MARSCMRVMAKNDIEQVHQTSLRIISEVGFKVDSPSVRRILEQGGAKVDNKSGIVRLDEKLVSSALKSAPRNVRICARSGRDYQIPSEGVQLVSPDGQPPVVLDVNTGEKRRSTLKDVIEFAVLCDALPEVDYVWPPVVATDMPSSRSSYYEFLASIAYCSKHIQHGATSAEEARFQVEVASAILGSKEDLRKRPVFSDVCTPISPLRYDQGEAEALVVLARAGVPLVHLTMGIAGSVSPVSVAGTLAIINAENLCGLTMCQIANPGAPSIYSSFSGVTDLKTGVFVCGTPEAALMDGAAIEMARHYGLPTCAGGPETSARSLSTEAAYQSSMTLMTSMMVGSDMLVGLGSLDRDAMVSAEKLVMDCEVWRWLKRLREGVVVDQNTLGFDAIKRQGPGGGFLSDPHTLKHMRKELLIPQVTSYHTPGEPDMRKDELREYARKRIREILSTHRPPLLSKEVAARVGKVAEEYKILLPNKKQIFEHA